MSHSNILIFSFDNSCISYFIDLIENYSSKFKFCLTDLNSSNYLQLTKNRYNTRTIYKFVFECNNTDFQILEYFKNKQFKFIFIDRNHIDIFVNSNISTWKF